MVKPMLQQIFADCHRWKFALPSKLQNVEPYITGVLEALSLSYENPQGWITGSSGRIGPKTTVFDVDSNVGAFIVDKDRLAVLSQSNFSTIRSNTCVYQGCWQYELMLGSKGVMQVGWTTASGQFSQEKGVGDTPDSYAYDGNRVRKWNVATHMYGELWFTGDVIGCTIDLDNGVVSFHRNGRQMGEAFSNVRLGPGYGYFPAVSLAYSENLVANFGASPFKYPVEGFKPLQKPPSLEIIQADICLNWFEKIVLMYPAVSLYRIDGISSKCVLLSVASLIFHHLGQLLTNSYVVEASLIPFLMKLCDNKSTVESLDDNCGKLNSSHVHTFLDLMWVLVEDSDVKICLDNVAVALLTSYRFSSTLNGYFNQKLYLKLTTIVLMHLRTRFYLLQNVLFDKIKFPIFLYVKPLDVDNLKLAFPCVWWDDDSCTDDVDIYKSEHLDDETCDLDGSKLSNTSSTICPVDKKEKYFADICNLRKTVAELENMQVKLLLLLMDDSRWHDKNITSLCLFAAKFREFLKENMVGSRAIPVRLCPLPVSLCFFHCLVKALRVLWSSCINQQSNDFFLKRSTSGKEDDGDVPSAYVPPYSFLDGGINYFENHASDESGVGQVEVRRLGGLASHLRKTYEKECSDAVEALSRASVSSDSASSLLSHVPSTQKPLPLHRLSDSNAGITKCTTLVEILDGVVLLYHIAAHKQLGKMSLLQENMQEYVVALSSTQSKLSTCRSPGDHEDVASTLLHTHKVFSKILEEQGRHMAWIGAVVYSSDKREDVDWLLKVVLRTLNLASKLGNVFSFVPDFYVDVCINSCSSLTNFFLPVSNDILSASFSEMLVQVAFFLSRHFMDKRIVSADIKDNLIQALASFVCRSSTLASLESITCHSRAVLVKKLLQPYENRAWAQSNWILLRFWKGCGFAFRYTQPPHLSHKLEPKLRHIDSSLPHQFHKPCPSLLYQRHVAETLMSNQEGAVSFLNSVLNQLNWAFSEFVGMLQEIQNASSGIDKVFIDSRQLKICSTCFDLAVALLRVIEMVTAIAPQLFIDWSRPHAEPLLARLFQLLCQVLNRVTSRSGCFDLIVGLEIQGLESIDHFPIVSAVVGILVSLVLNDDPKSSECATAALLAEPSFQISSLEFVLGLQLSEPLVIPDFGSRSAPQTSSSPHHKRNEYYCSGRKQFSLKNYNEVDEHEIGQVQRLIQHLWDQLSKSSSEIKDASEDDLCPICYAHRISAVFRPCGHQSCKACISHHLMNKVECFFCKSTIEMVVSSDGKILHDLKQKQTTV